MLVGLITKNIGLYYVLAGSLLAIGLFLLIVDIRREKKQTFNVTKVMIANPETTMVIPTTLTENYDEQWGHYDKIKEAILGLQVAYDSQGAVLTDVIRELLNTIQRERVYLDDSELQDQLDQFVDVVEECVYIGIPVDSLIANKIIGGTASRMNKRYKRNPIQIQTSFVTNKNKGQGQILHREIIALFNDLGNIKDKQSKDIKWQDIPEVRVIMDSLQIKFNDLGYLVKKEKYDKWVEAIMQMSASELMYHYNEHNPMNEWGRAVINRKLRAFVHSIRD